MRSRPGQAGTGMGIPSGFYTFEDHPDQVRRVGRSHVPHSLSFKHFSEHLKESPESLAWPGTTRPLSISSSSFPRSSPAGCQPIPTPGPLYLRCRLPGLLSNGCLCSSTVHLSVPQNPAQGRAHSELAPFPSWGA